MIAECQAIEKRERERKQREEAKQAREALERVQKWVDGESDYCPFLWSYPVCGSRATNCRLLAARGFPLAHAVKAFRVIKRLHDKGQAYQRNGHTIHLRTLRLDSIDSAGNVRAGCHEVAWEEIARVATLAGVN